MVLPFSASTVISLFISVLYSFSLFMNNSAMCLRLEDPLNRLFP